MKAYRLPTIEEMFGNEDLEMGDIGIGRRTATTST